MEDFKKPSGIVYETDDTPETHVRKKIPNARAKDHGPHKLNPRRKAFVAEYLSTGNATAAAKKAGYMNKRADIAGAKLKNDPAIAAEINKITDSAAARAGISVQYVLETVQETIQRCAQKVPVLDRKGKPTGSWQFDSGGVLKGCELLGKHLRMWAKEESGSDIGVQIKEIIINLVKPSAPEIGHRPIEVEVETIR